MFLKVQGPHGQAKGIGDNVHVRHAQLQHESGSSSFILSRVDVLTACVHVSEAGHLDPGKLIASPAADPVSSP